MSLTGCTWAQIPNEFDHMNDSQLENCFNYVFDILSVNGDFTQGDMGDIYGQAQAEYQAGGSGLNVLWGWIISVLYEYDATQYVLECFNRGHHVGGGSKKKRSKKKRSKKKGSKKKGSKKKGSKKRRSRKY